MEKQEMQGHYDYNVKEAYSKIESLIGKPVLFKDSKNDYPYTSARLQEAKIIKITDSDGYAINMVLDPPLIESKERLTPEVIFQIIDSYDKKTPEERRKIQEMSDPFLSTLSKTLSLEEEIKEIEKMPGRKFLKKKRLKKEALSNYASAIKPNLLRPLKITKPEDLPPRSIDYGGPWNRRVSSKEMVDTMEAIVI